MMRPNTPHATVADAPATVRLGALALAAAALVVGTGCDLNQDRVFPGLIEGVAPILDLGELTPIEVTGRASLPDAVIFGEIGPTGTPEDGGVSFTFRGTNTDVCVWIDPESVFWNQAVSPTTSSRYAEVDNPYDDGDLDLDAGQSLYYTGTPGERIGTFAVRYEDSNNNVVPIELSECDGPDPLFAGAQGIGKAGRAAPEYCTIPGTLEGADYTVVMRNWSTPIDDDRLGFGLLVMQGNCAALINNGFGEGTGGGGLAPGGGGSGIDNHEYECVITGEIIKPNSPTGAAAAAAGLPAGTWLGSEVPSWERSVEYEQAFCRRDTDDDGPGIVDFCRAERRRVSQAGEQCSWAFEAPEGGERCFCGDPEEAPDAGSF